MMTKTWKHALLIVAGAIGLAMGIGDARAWGTIDLHCYTIADGSWAQANGSGITTSVGASPETTHNLGFKFPADADREMECSAFLPIDYDDASTDPPYITLAGWATSHVFCPSGCAANRYVKFKVSSRRYIHDNDLNAAWGPEFSQTFTFPGEGTTSKTYKGHRLKLNWGVEPTDDASDWDAHDFVVIRIKRDLSVSDDLNAEFYIPQVLLHYPN